MLFTRYRWYILIFIFLIVAVETILLFILLRPEGKPPKIIPISTPAPILKEDYISSVKTDAVYTLKDYTTEYTLVDGLSNADINKVPGVTKETGTVNLPNGFFSDDPQEWGLIANGYDIRGAKPVPITVSIYFKQPVKITSIGNLFSNCQLVDCYKWQAVGVTSENERTNLFYNIVSGKDPKMFSVQKIDVPKQFLELHITVTRIDNKYSHILVWKKIKIDYKL